MDNLGTNFGPSWNMFSITLASVLDYLGTKFGQSWDHLGVILGSTLVDLGTNFVKSCGDFWTNLDYLGLDFWLQYFHCLPNHVRYYSLEAFFGSERSLLTAIKGL